MRGVDGLLVIDAAMMPATISGNTNAAAIMIGEKERPNFCGTTRGAADRRLCVRSVYPNDDPHRWNEKQ